MNAENLFKNFLEVFPNSTKAEELDYMRALCYYKMSPKVPLDQTNTIKAMGMLQTFINTHPGSTGIRRQMNLLRFAMKKWKKRTDRSKVIL